ncbi:MAG: von Willebrand factor type A domain-containing protein [Bacteroidales bacterium]|nr:von Willebrand factor type A domain-containing protein [Bacteroidales bacterium]
MKTKYFLNVLIFLLLANFSYSQTAVKGLVTDEKNKALYGVKVTVKNTHISTKTLKDGTFAVNVPSNSSILVFALKGKQTKEIKLTGKTYIKVILKDVVQVIEIVKDEAEFESDDAPVFGNVSKVSGSKKMYFNIRNTNSYMNYDDGGDNFNTEEYDHISENVFKSAKDNPVSTLSIDVDNASYSNVRRFLNSGKLPLKDAVRIEEMINYFTYDYPNPQGEHPFSFITEYSECPWNKENKLLHIGIQGKKLDYNDLKPSNFVFLLDVSGSMSCNNKLPLLKKSLLKLIDNLGRKDKVSIVVYAGAAGLVLPPTPAYEKDKIRKALNKLNAGGSTAGGAGIKLAYKTAKEAYIKGGNNRVILATDGDFNIGTSSTSELVRLIEEKRKDDIYLTILGFGMGNYKDGRMEQISNAGNGNYFYIDDIKEADKVFGKEMRANMFTIAKDVKIQIEFNPANVKAYRLIGYENRILNKEDFDDDTKDAGELGPGHTVTALYEIVPAGSSTKVKTFGKLKYQTAVFNGNSKFKDELMSLKFRYKPPKDDKSILIEHIVKNSALELNNTSDNFRFSASVAAFGMLLRDSEFTGNFDYPKVIKLASGSKGKDENGYRKEFIELIEKAKKIFTGIADKTD